jgi:hypothetical protein
MEFGTLLIIRSDDAMDFVLRQTQMAGQMRETDMRKIAIFGFVMAIAAVSVVIWTKSPDFTKPAQAIPAATIGISPHELHLQVDVKGMPVLEIANPI